MVDCIAARCCKGNKASSSSEAYDGRIGRGWCCTARCFLSDSSLSSATCRFSTRSRIRRFHSAAIGARCSEASNASSSTALRDLEGNRSRLSAGRNPPLAPSRGGIDISAWWCDITPLGRVSARSRCVSPPGGGTEAMSAKELTNGLFCVELLVMAPLFRVFNTLGAF